MPSSFGPPGTDVTSFRSPNVLKRFADETDVFSYAPPRVLLGKNHTERSRSFSSNFDRDLRARCSNAAEMCRKYRPLRFHFVDGQNVQDVARHAPKGERISVYNYAKPRVPSTALP